MSDVGRKSVPNKGRLNRERPVTKALEFPFYTGFFFFHRNWNGEYEMECTERQDHRYGDRVPSKKRKAKVAILKSILSLTGSQ